MDSASKTKSRILRTALEPFHDAHVVNVVERRRGDFSDPPGMRMRAQSRAEIESSRARVPNIAGCEFPPPTVLRTAALQSNSKRFRAAYGHHRSRTGAPHRTSSRKSPGPHTDPPRDVGLPLTMTSLAELSNSLHQTISRYRQEVRRTLTARGHVTNVVSRSHPDVSGSPSVPRCRGGNPETGVLDAMSSHVQQLPQHRYPPLRPRCIAGATGPLSNATVSEQRLCPTAPPQRGPVPPLPCSQRRLARSSQDKQSRYGGPVGGAKLCAVRPRSGDISDATIACDQQVSRHHYKLRFSSSPSASELLSAATAYESTHSLLPDVLDPLLRRTQPGRTATSRRRSADRASSYSSIPPRLRLTADVQRCCNLV